MSSRHHASFLLVTGTAGTMTKTLERCETHSGIISAAKQAVRINQTTVHDIGPPPPPPPPPFLPGIAV